MSRNFILIPALAAGIFLAQSGQQRAEALSAPAPTVTVGQTSNPMMTLVDWGGRGGRGYGGGWGRGGYGGGRGDRGGRGYGGGWGGHGGRGYGGGWGGHGGRGHGGRWG